MLIFNFDKNLLETTNKCLVLGFSKVKSLVLQYIQSHSNDRYFDDQNSYQLNCRFLCQIIYCQQRLIFVSNNLLSTTHSSKKKKRHLQCKRDKRKQIFMKI